jgi:hypothetical protein
MSELQVMTEPRVESRMTVERVDVWAASIADHPGALANLLLSLKEVGADLEFVLARRTPEAPGAGVVFVTPLRGDREIAAAAEVGFNVSRRVQAVRVEGTDRPGIAADLTRRIADYGISLRGFSAAVMGTRFIAHVALDEAEDADRVMEILKEA